jgi:hypothetical protein
MHGAHTACLPTNNMLTKVQRVNWRPVAIQRWKSLQRLCHLSRGQPLSDGMLTIRKDLLIVTILSNAPAPSGNVKIQCEWIRRISQLHDRTLPQLRLLHFPSADIIAALYYEDQVESLIALTNKTRVQTA